VCGLSPAPAESRARSNDIFARSKYDESQELDAALGKIGYKISVSGTA
jgi:hypothetical protein